MVGIEVTHQDGVVELQQVVDAQLIAGGAAGGGRRIDVDDSDRRVVQHKLHCLLLQVLVTCWWRWHGQHPVADSLGDDEAESAAPSPGGRPVLPDDGKAWGFPDRGPFTQVGFLDGRHQDFLSLHVVVQVVQLAANAIDVYQQVAAAVLASLLRLLVLTWQDWWRWRRGRGGAARADED